MKRILALLAALLILGGAALFFAASAPYAGFSNEVFVDIPKGTGTLGIARRLAEAGVVRSEWLFLAARAARPGATLKAGEYRFDKPASPLEVLNRIARGDVFLFALVVPEGHNMFDIANHLDASHVMQKEQFLAAARDSGAIRDLAPEAPSLEGYLFPDTYHFPRKTTAQRLTRIMVDRFRKAWEELGPPRTNVHETVTLASLVEKEARVPAERPVVASVYVNRLKVGMPLQCDPTTIYAALLENRWRGTIYRSDLDSRHPYNTYQNAGLPPGPIANPGLESLKAALHPQQTDYLYFVAKADGSGGHTFTTGLAEHAAAVRQYRRAVEEAGQAGGDGSVAAGTQPRPGQPGRNGRAAAAARTR